jgi:diaminopropionate ammonia-lyase
MEKSFYFNLTGTSRLVVPEVGRAALDFHHKLPGYKPPRLIDAAGLATKLKLGKVWVKDESGRLGLPAFKILGASWATYRALDERFGPFKTWETLAEIKDRLAPYQPLALTTATDGNHGRAVARMARWLGLGAKIFVPAGTVEARIKGIESEGATVTVIDGTYDEAVERASHEASDRCLVISDTSWPGYDKVPGWIAEGYSTIFWEIEDTLQEWGESGPDIALVQVGVGALASALVAHYRRTNLEPSIKIVSVEPEGSDCALASMLAGKIVTIPGPHNSIMAGLNCGTPSPEAWPLVSGGIDLFLSIPDTRAALGMRELAAVGVTSGETGAAGLGGLLEILQGRNSAELKEKLGLTESSRVLLISTEGATDPLNYAKVVGKVPV